MALAALTESDFDEKIKSSEKPILVDFWAEWCPPCKKIAPILEEIAAENPDLLEITKVDVDANVELQQRFEVQSIPTLLLFKDGELTNLRITGAKGKEALIKEIKEHL